MEKTTVYLTAAQKAALAHAARVEGRSEAERALLAEVAGGAYELEPFGADDVAAALKVLERYPDLDLGLADASLVVLADRYQVLDILTLDERRFRAVRGPHGRSFRILPVDSAA